MSVDDLMNRPMAIVRRTVGEDLDAYGNPLYDTQSVDVVGELQQIRRDEPTGEEFSDTWWNLFLPAGTDIRSDDVVLVDDEDYQVVGDPAAWRNPRTQTVKYVWATLRRTAAAGDEVEA